MELIFLDTETTGIDQTKDRLVQVCYSTKNGGTKVEYFKPPLPMSIKSMSITHITEKMLADKQPFENSQMKKDLEFLLSGGVLVAHNARFDISMLEAEGVKVPKFVDTLRVARFLDSKNVIPEYNLQFLRYYMGLEIEGNPHDAEGDVNVLIGVFDRLFSKVKEVEKADEATINKMIEISSTPSIFNIFNFGKYKDQRIEDVAKTDRGYLEWLLNQKIADGGADEDWIYTLNHYLGK
jgi:DNA polymerase III epsilon subunit-like protein